MDGVCVVENLVRPGECVRILLFLFFCRSGLQELHSAEIQKRRWCLPTAVCCHVESISVYFSESRRSHPNSTAANDLVRILRQLTICRG